MNTEHPEAASPFLPLEAGSVGQAALSQHPLAQQPNELTVTDAVAYLKGLFRYWLSPAACQFLVKEFVGSTDLTKLPALPATPGSCQILLIIAEAENGLSSDTDNTSTNPQQWPMLRQAMLLPLIWRERSESGLSDHDPRLPPDVKRVANDVIRFLEDDTTNGKRSPASEWKLHFADSSEAPFPDLSKWDALKASSGGVAIAGGLMTAIRGGAPKPDVWATGTIDPETGQVTEVEHLELKIGLAKEWDVSRFYVPTFQVTAARNIAKRIGATSLRIESLHSPNVPLGSQKLLEALGRYRAELMVPPGGNAEMDLLVDHLLALVEQNQTEAADHYYCCAVLPRLIQPLREKLKQQFRDKGHQGDFPDSLVTIVSTSPDLIRFTARVLEPRRCLLLYTDDAKKIESLQNIARELRQQAEATACGGEDDDTSQQFAKAAESVQKSADLLLQTNDKLRDLAFMLRDELRAESHDCHTEAVPFTSEGADTEIPALQNRFTTGIHPQSVLIDCTPAKSEFKVVNALTAPIGSWLYFIDSDYIEETRYPRPNTQQPRLIQATPRPAASLNADEPLTVDLSLANADLYAGCDIENVNGRFNLKTPVAEATQLLGRNIERIIDASPTVRRNSVHLTGRMAIWSYLVVFHAVVHRFREVYYDDGSGPVLISRHG